MAIDRAKWFLHHLVMSDRVVPGKIYEKLTERATQYVGSDKGAEIKKNLIDKGYLAEEKDDKFKITSEGYQLICKEKTVRGTQIIILLRMREMLSPGSAGITQSQRHMIKSILAPCRQDHFDEAIEGLVDKGIIEKDSLGGITLTGNVLEWEDVV